MNTKKNSNAHKAQQSNTRKFNPKGLNNVSSNSSISNRHLDFNSKIMTTYQEEIKSSHLSAGTSQGSNVFNTTGAAAGLGGKNK